MSPDDVLKKQLDEMLAGAPPPEEAGAPVATTLPAPPEAEPDPLAHLIGRQDPDADKDPFALMLDGMLAEEGLSKDTEQGRKTDGYEAHEWELKDELVYEEDLVNAVCKKCFRQMRMTREQTWSQAMEAHQVNPDCGMGITSEVMDS